MEVIVWSAVGRRKATKQNSCLWQYKIGSLGATTISFAWWRGSAPVLWRTALQAEYSVYHYPGTPPPSVYQVTHGTALQAAECYVSHRVLYVWY